VVERRHGLIVEVIVALRDPLHQVVEALDEDIPVVSGEVVRLGRRRVIIIPRPDAIWCATVLT
jgi:hypothetical protein